MGWEPARLWTWLWMAAAALILVFPLRLWTSPVGRALLRRPHTLADTSDPELAAVWRFLGAAAGHVPPGATYTCRAGDPVREMNLHMVSLGLIRHATARPSSYYGRPQPGLGDRAGYVLLMGGLLPDLETLEVVAEVEGGRVLRCGGGRNE